MVLSLPGVGVVLMCCCSIIGHCSLHKNQAQVEASGPTSTPPNAVRWGHGSRGKCFHSKHKMVMKSGWQKLATILTFIWSTEESIWGRNKQESLWRKRKKTDADRTRWWQNGGHVKSSNGLYKLNASLILTQVISFAIVSDIWVVSPPIFFPFLADTTSSVFKSS